MTALVLAKNILIEERYQLPQAKISVNLLNLYYKTMLLVLVKNTVYKYFQQVQPWTPECRHATLMFSLKN